MPLYEMTPDSFRAITQGGKGVKSSFDEPELNVQLSYFQPSPCENPIFASRLQITTKSRVVHMIPLG